MIDLEAQLTEAAGRLPGPDAATTERARARVLTAFAPAAYAQPRAGADLPVDDRLDAPGPGRPPQTRQPRRRRRLLAAGAGLATVAALAAAVIVAGLPHRATPPAPPVGTGTAPAPVPDVAPRLDGTIAYLRDDVLFTITEGAEPVRLARLPALDDPRIDDHDGARSLAVSPDGSRVAVISPGGLKRTVSIYDRATGDATTIPVPPNFTTSYAFFSGDGKTLFVRDRFASFAITDRAREIPSGAADAIAVAPDGSGIAVNGADTSGLVVLDSRGSGKRTIVPNATGAAGNVVWGPGADQPIAYVDGTGLHVVSAATPGAPSFLVGPDTYPLAFTRDGRELIVWNVGEATTPLEAIAIERRTDGSGTRYAAGSSRRLASLAATSYLGMTQDGTAFLVGGDPRNVRLVPVDGGPAQPIGVENGEALAWSGLTPAAG